MDEDAAQELTDDRYVLINMYGAIKKEPGFWPLYVQAGKVLRKYGLFDEEVTLLEKALAEGSFKEADLISAQDRLSKALQLREADDACLSDSERIALQIRRALQKKPADEKRIKDLLDQCTDDEIKEKLSVKINSTELITEMIFGDLSAIDMVFAFPKPKDLTLQDRFCVEIMKNHPDRNIREHVRKELIRGEVSIPGVDLSPP